MQKQAKLRFSNYFFLVVLLMSFVADNHQKEVLTWREKRIEALKSMNGYLNLSGLFWLKEGENTFGSDALNDFEFPKNHADSFLGSVILNKKGEVYFKNLHSDSILVYPSIGDPVIISHQTLRWFIIKRGEKFAIRLKDLAGEYLQAFKGIQYYPIQKNARIKAKFIPTVGRKIRMTDVTGRSYLEDSPGKLTFKMNGKSHSLDVGPGEAPFLFFIVFGDQTNKKGSYGGGRFMDIDGPDAAGFVIIDFNKAYNPPCAFTPYATCPLPTQANKLSIAIEAGEKSSGFLVH